MSIDKDKLRALAEAAGPKDYFAPQPYEEDRGYSDAEIRRLEFMAEADPATILALLDENDALRNGLKGDYDLDAWLAFVEEAPQLRKDAERYRWGRENGHWTDDQLDLAMAKEKSQ